MLSSALMIKEMFQSGYYRSEAPPNYRFSCSQSEEKINQNRSVEERLY